MFLLQICRKSLTKKSEKTCPRTPLDELAYQCGSRYASGGCVKTLQVSVYSNPWLIVPCTCVSRTTVVSRSRFARQQECRYFLSMWKYHQTYCGDHMFSLLIELLIQLKCILTNFLNLESSIKDIQLFSMSPIGRAVTNVVNLWPNPFALTYIDNYCANNDKNGISYIIIHFILLFCSVH